MTDKCKNGHDPQAQGDGEIICFVCGDPLGGLIFTAEEHKALVREARVDECEDLVLLIDQRLPAMDDPANERIGVDDLLAVIQDVKDHIKELNTELCPRCGGVGSAEIYTCHECNGTGEVERDA